MPEDTKKLVMLKDFELNQIGFDNNNTQFYIIAKTPGVVKIKLIEGGNTFEYPADKEAYTFEPPKFFKPKDVEEEKTVEGTPPEPAEEKQPEKEEETESTSSLETAIDPKLVKLRQEAEKNDNLIRQLNTQIDSRLLALGLALYKNKQKRYWEILDYSTFRTYMASNISSQSRGYRSIEIAETLVVQLGFEPASIEDIGEKKLGMVVPRIREITNAKIAEGEKKGEKQEESIEQAKEEASEWVEKARTNSASELQQALDKWKNKGTVPDTHSIQGNELFLSKDNKLFCRDKIGVETNLTALVRKYPSKVWDCTISIKFKSKT